MVARMYRRLGVGLALGFALAAVLSLAFYLNFLSGLQAQSTDVLFKVRPTSSLHESAQRIALIALDDKSLDRLGYWVTWDRSYYTRVIRFLADAKARVVALDVSFEQPRAAEDPASSG